MNASHLPIADIAVGVRHRKDLGDIDGLARSIREIGLLHPVVVRADSALIAGERRLAACKALGWKDIPITIVDLDEIVRGEFAENAIRKDFLPSEIDAIRRALEPFEKNAARQRMSDGARVGKVSTPSKTRAVAECKSVDEAKDIRDKAVAMSAYARQAKNRDLEADAVEIRMRATRRLDQLRQAQKETVGLAQGKRTDLGLKKTQVDRPTLAEAGIDKNLAHHARTLGAGSKP